MQLNQQLNRNTLLQLQGAEGKEAFSGFANEDRTEFSINTGSHLMKILSSSLYTDKIGAVVRELIANARDAWVSVPEDKRNPVAFDITITQESYTVRDYGIGLSKEATMKLMTTYGLSTKQGENTSIGAYGLGSKSPFAYTQEFTMTSYYNNYQHTFHAILGASGVPEMIHLSSIPTTEPNGVMFRIPFTSNDWGNFRLRAIELCKSIGVPSNVSFLRERVESFMGDELFTGEEVLFSFDGLHGSRVHLLSQQARQIPIRGPSGFYIGGIRYDVPSHLATQPDILHACRIELPIGSVDIAVSREVLEGTKKTKETILAILVNAANTLQNYFTDKIIRLQAHLHKADTYNGLPFVVRKLVSDALFDRGLDNDFVKIVKGNPVPCPQPDNPNATYTPTFDLYPRGIHAQGVIVLQDSPKPLTRKLLTQALTTQNQEQHIRRSSSLFMTREEWLNSSLGVEIAYAPNRFVFSSDVVLPKAPKKEKIKLADTEIKVGKILKGNVGVKAAITKLSDLPADAIFFPSDKFPRASMRETIFPALKNFPECLPFQANNIYIISTADVPKVSQSQLFNNVYTQWLVDIFSTASFTTAYKYCNHWDQREFVGKYFGSNAAAYMFTYRSEYNTHERAVSELKNKIENFLTTAKELGILTPDLHKDVLAEQQAKQIEIDKTKPVFDVLTFVSLFNTPTPVTTITIN